MKKILIALGFLLLLIPLVIFAQDLSPTDELHLTRGGATPTPTATPFSPDQVAGLHDWYDFSDTTTLFTDSGCSTTPVSLNGDLIGCIKDKSGNNNHAFQATDTKKFVWTLPGWNGLGVGTSDGTDDSMQTAAFANALSQPTTIFVVARMTGDFAGTRTFYAGITSGGDQLYHVKTSGLLAIHAGTALESADATSNTPLILTAIFNGASSALFKNGSSIASGAAGSNNLQGVTLGATYIGTGRFLGNFGELLVYNPSPSAANQALIESYLWAKWGFPYAQYLPRDYYLVQAHRLP